MEHTSIQSDTIPSMHRGHHRADSGHCRHGFLSRKAELSLRASTGVSKRFTSEVRPAKATAIKNTVITILPPGIWANTLGRYMNISPGPPPERDWPAVAMAGIIVTAAASAAIVSQRATVLALYGMSTSLFEIRAVDQRARTC